MDIKDRRFVVVKEDRLDRALQALLPEYSRANVKDLIAEGRARLNGRRCKKGGRVGPGDEIVVLGLPEGPPPLPDFDTGLAAVYEHKGVLVVDKPAGIATHPLSPEERGTLANRIVAYWPQARGVGGKPLEPGLIHRLDAGTRGLVLVALDNDIFDALRHDMKMRRIGKTYLALVRGTLDTKSGEIRQPLARHPSRAGAMVAARGEAFRGKPLQAVTRYRVIGDNGDASLVELDLITGVTHQLRVHLAGLGHPVLGDALYGPEGAPEVKAPDQVPGRDHALQASSLSFRHPATEKDVKVHAPRPLSLGDAELWLD